MEWRPVQAAAGALPCGHVHDHGAGTLDEQARRLSHEELAVADRLAAEGHQVRSLPESRHGGRRADLSVCGVPVEVKSFAPVEERRTRPGARSVFNKLVDAAGQARHVVLIDRGSGLSAGSARQGMGRWALAAGPDDRLDSVRVMGDGFDLAWTRSARREIERAPLVSGAGVLAPERGRTPARREVALPGR